MIIPVRFVAGHRIDVDVVEGHHFSDVIETPVMSMFYGGQLQAMLPKLHSQNFEGMELIRPLYYVREDAIKALREHYKGKILLPKTFTNENHVQEIRGLV